jgi:hypothetical protein
LQALAHADYYRPQLQTSEEFKERLTQDEERRVQTLVNFKKFIDDAALDKSVFVNMSFSHCSTLRKKIEAQVKEQAAESEMLLTKTKISRKPTTASRNNTSGSSRNHTAGSRRHNASSKFARAPSWRIQTAILQAFGRLERKGFSDSKAVVSIHCRNLGKALGVCSCA